MIKQIKKYFCSEVVVISYNPKIIGVLSKLTQSQRHIWITLTALNSFSIFNTFPCHDYTCYDETRNFKFKTIINETELCFIIGKKYVHFKKRNTLAQKYHFSLLKLTSPSPSWKREVTSPIYWILDYALLLWFIRKINI